MIEWAVLASAATVASDVVQAAGSGYFSNQSDRKISQLIGKIASNLKTQTPAENHELAKAFRRACLTAAQNICDSRKTTQSGQSNLAIHHKVSSKLFDDTPKGLFAENEAQWLEKANHYLKSQVDRLNKDKDFLPDKNISQYEHLINSTDIKDQVWANQLQRQLTKDIIDELTENVGGLSDSIEFEINSRWFIQTSNEFQKALSNNPILANKFENNMLVKLDSGQQDIMQLLQRIFAKFKIIPDDLPQLVGSLIERSLFVNRKTEKENLENWLTTKSKKIIVIEAASGYGKTSLLMEVLHNLSSDGKSLGGKLDAVLIFLCREGEGAFREICKKVDKRLGENENKFVECYENFVEKTKEHTGEIPADIISDLIDKLKALGNVWMVFDNFETVLNNQIINEPHLQAFFEKALQLDGIHFLLTSQKVPEFKTRATVEEIAIGILPEKDVLEFFQEEGNRLKSDNIDCGLAEINAEDLQKLKGLGFEFVPMALVALVGYFQKSYPRYAETLPKVLEEEKLFARFREHDAKEGSIYLIGLQYQNSSAVERLTLKTLSIFQQSVEFPTLEKILAEQIDDETLFAILIGNSLIRRIGANLYELLPQAKEAISRLADKEDEVLTKQQIHYKAAIFYNSIRQPIKNCYTREQFEPYFYAIDHCYSAGLYDVIIELLNEDLIKLCALGYMEQIIDRCILLKEKLSEPNLEANNYQNLGIALGSLGRLNEAVAEYDKAIKILEELVNEKGRVELANVLAMAYMNKGSTLDSLGRLNEAVAELDKAIKILEELVNEKGRVELANELAMVYVNKGTTLYSLRRLNEAVAELDKAIKILEELVNEKGRVELANELAMAYMNKGNALYSLERLNEAVHIYSKASIFWENALQRGEFHILPNLIKAFKIQVRVLINLKDWKSLATNVMKSFGLGLPVLESKEFPEHFKQLIEDETRQILMFLCEVSLENREEIYKHAGKAKDWLREFVESFCQSQQNSTE